MSTAVATSPDGQWIAVRQATEVRLYALDGAEAGVATLSTTDADLAIVGPPTTAIAVERGDGETTVVAFAVPGLGETARVTVDGAYDLAATTGPRLGMLSRKTRALGVLRASGRAFMSQAFDPGGPVEIAAGLDRNQMLLVLAKRLEVWDAVSGRPLLRPTFTLPPAPRKIGSAAGHVWCFQPGGSELILYRLSDGRPFAHRLGSPIEQIISHPAAPYVVAVTAGGLMRIQAFAHTIDRISAPPAEAYALAGAALTANLGPTGASGTDLRLIGATPAGAPWRQALVESDGEPAAPPPSSSEAMEQIRAARDRAPAIDHAPARTSPAWRAALASFALELPRLDPARATDDVPALPTGTSLSELCQLAALTTPARRALTVLYGCYLAGDPGISIARLASLVGGDDGWREALATGELGERGMLASRGGTVALVDAVARALDGAAPRTIEVIGTGAASVVPGAHVIDPARLGEPIAALSRALGRFALVTGALSTAVIEAFAHGLTAVAIAGPTRLRPVHVPVGGGLIVVANGAALPPSMAMWPTLDPPTPTR